ncbi:hypothetical protein [Streptomyces sp. NPDC047042]|uniref:hypothetical protein n=1 Tax=Streptomyces sp. NPDC047042 TaxID=3154807 RepID=UPI0033CEE4B0
MPLEERRTWALLRQLDDPEHLEFPRGYDHAATRALFEQLASRLGRRFQCACSVDRGVEDASHHGTIVIPHGSTVSGEHITVTVSNFGNLAAVTLGTPGSYDEGEDNILFEKADQQRIDDELEALGYISVSEHLLWTPYDGVSELGPQCSKYPPRWWTRFFDYL